MALNRDPFGLTITREGVQNESTFPTRPIPSGTKMIARYNPDGTLTATDRAGTIFIMNLPIRYFKPDLKEHERTLPNYPIVCLVITKEGLKTSKAPFIPIPVGTILQGRINIDGDIEDAQNDDGTIFVNEVHRTECKIQKGSCSVSGGRSKRKRKRKTKKRYLK